MSCFVDRNTMQQRCVQCRRNLIGRRFQMFLRQGYMICARSAERIADKRFCGGTRLAENALRDCGQV